MRASGSTLLGWWLVCSVAMGPMGARAALAATAFHVETRVAMHAVLVNVENVTRDEWTCPDRQSVDFSGPVTSLMGSDRVPTRSRGIIRLDRRLVWTVDFTDSTYTETPFDIVRSCVRLRDSLVANAGGQGWLWRRSEKSETPETLAVAERVAGVTTVHLRQKGPPPGGSGLAAEPDPRTEWWEARDLPGLDAYHRFVVARDSLLGPDAEAARSSGWTGSGGAFDALARTGAASGSGYPMRLVVRMDLSAGATDTSAAATLADSTLRKMGIDPASHSMTLIDMEVVRVEFADARADRFEVPRGFRRKASIEEQWLEDVRQAAETEPGQRK